MKANRLLELTGIYHELEEFFRTLSRQNNYQILRKIATSPKTFSELMLGLRKNPCVVDNSVKELSGYDLIKKESKFAKYESTEAGDLAFEIGKRDVKTMDVHKTAEDIIKLTQLVEVL